MTAICGDCGLDTTPCTGKRYPRKQDRWEWYMVKHSIWKAAGMPRWEGGYLCIGCLEGRIGRKLTPKDFMALPVNEPSPFSTDRLRDRRGD